MKQPTDEQRMSPDEIGIIWANAAKAFVDLGQALEKVWATLSDREKEELYWAPDPPRYIWETVPIIGPDEVRSE